MAKLLQGNERVKIAQQMGAEDAENVGGADAAGFLAAPLTQAVKDTCYARNKLKHFRICDIQTLSA